MELDLESQNSNSTEPLAQTNSQLPAKTKKAPSVKQMNAPQKSSLIETITARLNLATEARGGNQIAGGNPLGSLFTKEKQKPMAPVAPTINTNLTTKSDWSKQSEVKSHKSSPKSNNHDDTANNALSDLNTADYNRGKLSATDEVDACSVTGKKAANFGCSLYGLDTDEDEKSSMDKQLVLLNTNNPRQKKCSAEELDSSLPLPPPPIGFDDNNNEVDKAGTNNYENIDFDYDLIEQISKEFQKNAVKMLNASNSPYSPLFIDQSRNSYNCTVTSVSNDLLNEEPTK